MKPDDRVRLLHMADARTAIMRFAEGRTREDLDNDTLVFALMHGVQIVGEAASRISAKLREEHPEIPWAAIVGMRNRLAHAYFDINLDILWTTATESVPFMRAQFASLLSSE